MKGTALVKKKRRGRVKSPELEIVDLGELKKKVIEVKERKKGIYLRQTLRSRDRG